VIAELVARRTGWLVPLISIFGLSAASVGCGGASSGGLRVKQIAGAVEKPANVAVYFTVETKAGEPVTGLAPASFRIFEDGRLVPEKKAKRMLLDPRQVEARFTLILVDLSGPIVDSEYLPDLVRGVGQVAEAASHDGQVAISVFDGEDEVVPMLGFGAKGGREALEAIRKFRPRNRTTNLNGAVQQGVEAVRHQLAGSTAAHRYGSLVVFTDRGDLAHKVTAEALKKTLDAQPVLDVFVIAVGAEVKDAELAKMARGGIYVSKQPKDTAKGGTDIAHKIEGASGSHYVFSYCSPKRKGSHELEVEVETTGEDRDVGKLTYKFSAEGFSSGCSPKHKPDFAGGSGASP
jgi:Glucokinase